MYHKVRHPWSSSDRDHYFLIISLSVRKIQYRGQNRKWKSEINWNDNSHKDNQGCHPSLSFGEEKDERSSLTERKESRKTKHQTCMPDVQNSSPHFFVYFIYKRNLLGLRHKTDRTELTEPRKSKKKVSYEREWSLVEMKQRLARVDQPLGVENVEPFFLGHPGYATSGKVGKMAWWELSIYGMTRNSSESLCHRLTARVDLAGYGPSPLCPFPSWDRPISG